MRHGQKKPAASCEPDIDLVSIAEQDDAEVDAAEGLAKARWRLEKVRRDQTNRPSSRRAGMVKTAEREVEEWAARLGGAGVE